MLAEELARALAPEIGVHIDGVDLGDLARRFVARRAEKAEPGEHAVEIRQRKLRGSAPRNLPLPDLEALLHAQRGEEVVRHKAAISGAPGSDMDLGELGRICGLCFAKFQVCHFLPIPLQCRAYWMPARLSTQATKLLLFGPGQ